MLDELDFSDPDPAVLIKAGETPAALYVWALAARGRAAAGIANVSAHLHQEPFAHADYYAQPSSVDGARLLAQLGFVLANSFQPSLWTYRQLCNRIPAAPRQVQEIGPMMNTIEQKSDMGETNRATTIRIARNLTDLMIVASIRSAVYLAEQACPYEEEFDGNDLVAPHFIGFIGNEPVASRRARFFADFAKVERLAVRPQCRRSMVAFKLVRACVTFLKRKGSAHLRPAAGPLGGFLGAVRRKAARP
jgi:GNAT superfamily N-acetyltransferase